MPGDPDAAARRWRSSQQVTAGLLGVWAAVTFGITYFARELGSIVQGWPFSFWVASQGALLIYLVLVCVYARWMRRLDVRHGFAEGD